MTPDKHDLPLLICHAFPYEMGADQEDKKRAVTEHLIGIRDRGFGGVVTNVSFVKNYTLDEEEWRVFSFVADECERLGLRLWIYDEHGYPSGTAGGLTIAEDPDFEAIGIVMVKKLIGKGESITLELPRGHEHFLYAGVYPVDEMGTLIPDNNGMYNPLFEANINNTISPVTLKNESEERACAVFFVRKRLYEGTHAVHNVWESRRYIDLTNPDAVSAFLRNTYDKYFENIKEHFGAGASNPMPPIGKVEAIFTDEPSLQGCYINSSLYPEAVHDNFDPEIPLYPVISYGRDVEKKYIERYGRDLCSELVYIFLGDTERAMSIREDYYRILTELYENSYFVQISKWCESHKVSLSGHLLLEDDIRYHTVFEGNFFSLLRHMHYPGIDMLDSIPEHMPIGAYAFTPKLVSSVAHHYDRPHVMSEASGLVQGNNVSAEQMYASVAAQYAMGVDIFTYYYGFDFLDPETYTKYNYALGRIARVMSGKHIADVLLYYPIETLQRHHRPSDREFGEYDARENRMKDELWKIMNTLLRYQIDFDFVDAEALSRMKKEGDKLVSASGEEYSILVLPPMERTDYVTRVLDEVAYKVNVIGYNDVMVLSESEIAEPILRSLSKRAPVSDKAVHGVLSLTRNTETGLATLLVNTNNSTTKVEYILYGMHSPVLYDPMDDAVYEIEAMECDGGYRVKFNLPPYRSLIIKER